MSKKNRPTNGPGANHLRGGAGVYSAKTAVGTWMEGVGGPSGYTRGYTTDEFLTEAQIAQMQGKKMPKYGAGLPPPRIALSDRTPTEFALSVIDTDSNHFKSTSAMDMESINKVMAREEYAPKKKTGGTDMREVEAYRASWTTETTEGRKQRFDTESRRAANVSVKDDFKVRSLRSTPGVPQGFEKIEEGLSEKYGILGLTAFRKELGRGGERDSPCLRLALMNCGVKLSREHFGQVLAYLTRGDTFSAEKLFQVLTPPCDEFDSDFVSNKFEEYFGRSGAASVQDVAELYPELEMALLKFLDVYAGPDNEISPAEFMVLHLDMFTSMPFKYKNVIQKA